MGMVTIEDLDVDAGLGHATRQAPELPRLLLIQTHREDLAIRQDPDPGVVERAPRALDVRDEEMRKATAGAYKRAAAFNTHPCGAERLAHLGERARPVRQLNRQISHH